MCPRCLDAQRDLKDVGVHLPVIDGCKSLDVADKKTFTSNGGNKKGILFSTYSTLISGFGKKPAVGKKSRLEQLCDWCGNESFEGVLVFDECHKAKNGGDGKGKEGAEDKAAHAGTQTAKAVVEIQRMLPRARVVYASATGVSDLKNMAYAERLGLWGKQLPFEDFGQFLESIEGRGIGALEMVRAPACLARAACTGLLPCSLLPCSPAPLLLLVLLVLVLLQVLVLVLVLVQVPVPVPVPVLLPPPPPPLPAPAAWHSNYIITHVCHRRPRHPDG
jgi:hypothetical protein